MFNHNDIKKISYTLKGGFNENNPDLSLSSRAGAGSITGDANMIL